MKKTICEIISWLALAATIGPCFLFFADRMSLNQVKHWMLAATLAWFVSASLWMRHKVND